MAPAISYMHGLLQCQTEVLCVLHAGFTYIGDLSMTYVHGTSTNNGFCEYQGHLGGADALWVSIEFVATQLADETLFLVYPKRNLIASS